MSTCGIRLKFVDSPDEDVIIVDKQIIKMIPKFAKIMQAENPKWETEDTIVTKPVSIPFKRAAGEFLFNYVQKYAAPDDLPGDVTLENFKEASEKSLGELRVIISLAYFLECHTFMHCIAFCIARQLDGKSPDDIAEFMGYPAKEKEVEDGIKTMAI